jgi:hypothetical protein
MVCDLKNDCPAVKYEGKDEPKNPKKGRVEEQNEWKNGTVVICSSSVN